jgi:CheY-like chemotaxis protein
MKPYKTVLVVEDDPFLREAVCEFIQYIRPTWHTVEAPNGKKGIELAETAQPDLILTDLCMPVMDGYEMVITLQKKSETRAIPLILNTSEDTSCPVVNRLRTICREVLFKPFLFDELDAALERVMPTNIGTERNSLYYAPARTGGKPRLGFRGTYLGIKIVNNL